jgi:hypothetical protein
LAHAKNQNIEKSVYVISSMISADYANINKSGTTLAKNANINFVHSPTAYASHLLFK